jgi:RND superfamily putative drug exporter
MRSRILSISIEGIAGFSGRRPWWTLLGWLLILVAAGALASTLLESALDGDDGPTQVLENQRAEDLINDRFGSLDATEPEPGEGENGRSTQNEFVIVSSTTSRPGEPAFEQRIDEFGTALTAAQEEEGSEILVGTIRDYEFSVSEDGTTALATVEIYSDHEDEILTLLHVAEEFTDGEFEFLMVGNASVNITFSELAESDLLTGESIGIAVALIILALVFGAVVSAFIPILLAIAAIFTAIGLTAIIGQFTELNEFVPNIMTMMGLAVGIDYALFVLSRYNEERENGLEKQAAIEAASSTAGRAVVFSGFTVVVALLGMLIIPERIFQAFGIGAIVVVFVAVVTSVTLLPALIGILGDRVNGVRAPLVLTLALFIVGSAVLILSGNFGPAMIIISLLVMLILVVLTVLRNHSSINSSFGLGPKERVKSNPESGMWNAITVNVMKRPYASMTIAVGILLVLGFFYFELEKGTSGISVLPDEEPVKQAFERLDEKFGFGSDERTFVVIDGDVGSPQIAAAIASLEQAMDADPGLSEPETRSEPSVQLARISAKVPGDPSNQSALQTIRKLRNDTIPEAFAGVPESSYEAYVGGESASIVDSVNVTDQYLPIVFVAVLGLSFILLLFAFRSITVSIASIIMNLLSVGAAYGLVVLVFQKGFLIDVFGFEQVDQIEFWLPLFMFSILFGLSMDYHVFMLSRIKERFDETGDANESVAFGLRTTASIITGAALIMVAVFGGFALGDIAFFQSMGFGLGAAVLLDATVVRSLLVPSVMRILGEKAWYFPSWMEWLPNISIEGQVQPAASSVEEGAPSGGDD